MPRNEQRERHWISQSQVGQSDCFSLESCRVPQALLAGFIGNVELLLGFKLLRPISSRPIKSALLRTMTSVSIHAYGELGQAVNIVLLSSGQSKPKAASITSFLELLFSLKSLKYKSPSIRQVSSIIHFTTKLFIHQQVESASRPQRIFHENAFIIYRSSTHATFL